VARGRGARGAPAGALVDLHTHTLASDGGDHPRELVAAAGTDGGGVLAVTDH
jgi:3',5'-nucleoside bisphosphate phosphatase